MSTLVFVARSARNVRQLPGGLAAPAVHPDLRAEGPQAGPVRHDHVIAGLVPGLLHLADARDDPQPGQQAGDPVREFPARGRVVHLGGGLAVREPDAAVGRPQVAQEEADLGVGGRVEDVGQALVVRAQVTDAKLTEPVMDRVSPTDACSARALAGRRATSVCWATRRGEIPNSAAAAASTKARFSGSFEV